ncbi:MAG: helix-turn-helix transcriptional regulator [Tetrasphaera sp.]
MNGGFDVVGLLLRVRRRADLSQRDLAAELGVSAATIAKWESGLRPVPIDVLVSALRLADLTLQVVSPDGSAVAPFPKNTLRDNAFRRFPAHLDLDPPEDVPALRRVFPRYDRPPAQAWYALREERDRRRTTGGVSPEDHLTEDSLAALRAQRRRDGPPPRRAPGPVWEMPECTCLDECFETVCVPECPCRCEAIDGDGAGSTSLCP